MQVRSELHRTWNEREVVEEFPPAESDENFLESKVQVLSLQEQWTIPSRIVTQ